MKLTQPLLVQWSPMRCEPSNEPPPHRPLNLPLDLYSVVLNCASWETTHYFISWHQLWSSVPADLFWPMLMQAATVLQVFCTMLSVLAHSHATATVLSLLYHLICSDSCLCKLQCSQGPFSFSCSSGCHQDPQLAQHQQERTARLCCPRPAGQSRWKHPEKVWNQSPK